MNPKVEAKLLTATSIPYNFNGNSGVSHKIRINVDGEIFVCDSTAEQVEQYKDSEGKDGEALLKFSSPKEKLKLKLISFV